MRLAGRTAIVTGAASGIGRGIALRFAEEGANVCIADIDEERAKITAAEVEKSGVRAVAVKTDVSDSKDVEEMARRTINELGTIDILVNNAGIKHISKLTETSEELWNEVIAVNLTGVFLCCKAVLPHMIDRKKGKIINISSIVEKLGIAERCAYTASKGGVSALTRMLAWELAGTNINVNAIGPGLIEVETLTVDIHQPEISEKVKALTPTGRVGDPRDIANAALYLASDESDFVNGIVLHVDGGWLSGKGF